jgi:hypothetical protein
MFSSCDAVPEGRACGSQTAQICGESGERHVELATPTLFRSRFRLRFL